MKNSKTGLYIPIMMLCLVLLSNCTPDALVTPIISPLASPISESPIATPSNTETIKPVEWVATPEPGMAIIRGYIQMPDPPTALLGELLLAKSMATSNPGIELLELEQENAPKAIITRESMAFIFLNIEPGRYGIVAWEPMNSMVLNDPDTGETLFIDVQANDIIDIGTLNFP